MLYIASSKYVKTSCHANSIDWMPLDVKCTISHAIRSQLALMKQLPSRVLNHFLRLNQMPQHIHFSNFVPRVLRINPYRAVDRDSAQKGNVTLMRCEIIMSVVVI